MIKNYIKVAFRNLLKSKGFTFINITGLAIGIASCILILLYVNNELSYDRFNEKADRIYRVCLDGQIGDNVFNLAVSPAPMAQTLARDFPEVETATRIRNFGFPVIRYNDKVFSEERFFWADSNIFDVFTIPFIKGDPKTALTQPTSVVITEAMAKKYFGNEDPMGKSLNADKRRDYLVTGVVKDFPSNAHFHFDFLGSLSTYDNGQSQSFLGNNFYTYIVLKKGTSWEELNNKLPTALLKYIKPQIEQALGTSWDAAMKKGYRYQYFLQPLTDIHLNSHLDNEIEPNSNITYIYIFSLIAIAILGIAVINFMNLSTAKSSGRAKEVGIRKTLGSNFGQLTRQFLTESVILSLIAVMLSIIIVQLLLPYFNELAGKNLSVGYFSSFIAIPAIILFAIFVGLVSGSYPAFFLSSFRPVSVLSGNLKRGKKGKMLRSGLVIFQFSVSIILLIGTFIIYSQLKYIQNKDLGYNKDQLIIIHKTDDIGRFMEAFKNDLERNPDIVNVSNATTLPGMDYGSNAWTSKEAGGQGTRVLMTFAADYDFAKTFQIKMAEGRYYSKDHAVDTVTSIVINEAAAKELQLTKPYVGKQLVQINRTVETSRTFDVVGVVKNFNFESLHNNIRPMVIFLFRQGGFGRYVAAKVKPENIQSTLSYIKDTWKKFAGNQEFEYTFFDDDFAKIYESEQRTGKIFTSFSVLAILIACLGLLGLAAFTTEQRTKEIGIRKAMGASIASILILLSKEFAKWVVIANIIAWPLAYFVMNKWLQDFAYRIDIHFSIFFYSGIIALFIAVITVSTQALKAAMTNPVESLRYE